MPKLTDPISPKSTKAELFAAYEEMKEKFEEAKKEELPPAQKETARRQEALILTKTESYTSENLETEINGLSQKIQISLEAKKKELIAESQKLAELRQAIQIETQKLDEIHHIALAADTLQTLIADYELKEKDLSQKFDNLNIQLQEEISQKKKSWEREYEEYLYDLKISRKKEKDDYEAEQAKKQTAWQMEMDKKETEFNERKLALDKQAEENERMREQVQNFPEELEQKIKEAKDEQEKLFKKDFAVEKQLFEQKSSAEKGILEVKVANLEDIIKNQSAEIVSLKKALAEAHQQSQSLATSVVESAAAIRQKAQESVEREEKKKE